MRRAAAILLACGLLLGAACGTPAGDPEPRSISADELAERLGTASPPLILDVRTREEFQRGHIPGALNIPHDELATRVRELAVGPSAEIVVHCQSGRRAEHASVVLGDAGYSNLRDLAGHWQGWQALGLPTE